MRGLLLGLLIAATAMLVSGSAAAEHSGERVLLNHLESNGWDLVMADPSTSEVTYTSATEQDEYGGSFSPDGSRVSFSSLGRRSIDLFVMNRDGSGRERVTGGGTGEFSPEWSPDATKIVYTALRPGMTSSRGAGIWILDVATGERTQISRGRIDFGAQWSPNGAEIVFYGRRHGDYELMKVDVSADPPDMERLTRNREDDLFPAWDASGESIVYTGQPRGRSRRRLYRLDLESHAKTRLTARKTTSTGELGVVSPDGSQIAFLRCPGTTCALWVMDSDGGAKRELFDGGVDDGAPAWSPDGGRLAFTWQNQRHEYKCSVVEVESGEVTRLTQLRGDLAVADWG